MSKSYNRKFDEYEDDQKQDRTTARKSKELRRVFETELVGSKE